MLNQRDFLVKENVGLKKRIQYSDSLKVGLEEKIDVLHKSVDLLNLKSESQQKLIENYEQDIDNKTRQYRKRNLGVGLGGFTLGLLIGVIIF